jgi:preprotein translocase subunit SecE
MASVMKRNEGNQAMADEPRAELPDPADLGGGAPAATLAASPRAADRGTGFFTIYKRGQGYWTRMGTAIAAGLIAFLTANFIFTHMRAYVIGTGTDGRLQYIPTSICLAVAGAFLVAILFVAWRKMNKPANADFLIATDSEMKKVNWTTKKELIGSTKVVIFFVILISLLLFVLDVIFGYFFHLIKVLQFGPFQ